MLEIYNETIRDLLSTSKSSTPESSGGKQYTIKHDANGNTHVTDLTVVDVRSAKEFSYLLNQAANSRQANLISVFIFNFFFCSCSICIIRS